MRYLTKRAIAYFIDCLICYLLIMLIIQWAILSNIRIHFGMTDEWFQNSVNLELYVLLTISFPVWCYFIYFDSNKANGTIGKRMMKLSVVDLKKDRIYLSKSLLRTLMKLFPWEIAHVGIIFPTPIYFAQDTGIRSLTIIGISLFVIYVLSIIMDNKRQSIYDKILKTVVITK